MTLVYHVYYLYRPVFILEVVELLQKHRGHVDVSLLATCEQHIRCLRGAMLFLLMLKSATALRVFRTMAASAAILVASLSKLFWPMISGIILMVALSSMGNLLFSQGSNNFSTLFGSLKSLLWHRGGLGAEGLHSSWGVFLFPGLFLSSTLVWMSAVIAVVSSLVTSVRRRQHREDGFNVAQLFGCIMGRHKKLHIENRVEEKTYYFEEFESLLDELLFRLSALSNSLHHTLPPKGHRYREDSPILSPMSALVDAQSFRMQMTEESVEEILPASPLHLSEHEIEESQGEFQPNFKTHLQHPGPATLIQPWGEIKQNEKESSCVLGKNSAAHKEVLVEVLIHKNPAFEPGT